MKEREVAEWLLDNEQQLQEQIKVLYRESHHLFPPAMHEIYLQQYQDGVLSIVKDSLGKNTNINPEELQTLVTKGFLRKITPKLLEHP